MPQNGGTSRRVWPAAAVGAGIFLTLYWPSSWGRLIAMREFYRAAEAVGVMDPRAGLGGQVLGRNFARDPRWLHPLISGAAGAAGFGPALVLSLLAISRLAGRRATWCGRCGAELRNLAEARCPSCGAPL
jgi:hypothetical protein